MDFENILIKQLIDSGEFFGKAMPILQRKYFASEPTKVIFEIIKEHYNEYSNIPNLTDIAAKVKNVSSAELRNEIMQTLGQVYMIKASDNIKSMLDETVSFVKDAICTEALITGADSLEKKDDKLRKKAQALMEQMAKVTIDTELGAEFADLEGMIAYLSNRNNGVLTQHLELNKRLGDGFLKGTLSLIAAASGIGKSLLMTDLISGMIKEGKNVLLVSLEMKDREIMKRVYSNALGLPINALADLNKTPAELQKIQRFRPTLSKEEIIAAYRSVDSTKKVGRFFVKDYPPGTFTSMMLVELVKQYEVQQNTKFDAVFVDYLGIMGSDVTTQSAGLYSYVKSMTEELRKAAILLDLPIISASQLNRTAYKDYENADNSTVSDSIGSVQTADFMLFLLQDEEMKKSGEMLLRCTKNRFTGRTDTWKMNIDYTYMQFSDKEEIQDSAATPDQETWANKEIGKVHQQDMEIIKKHDKNIKPTDDDILKALDFDLSGDAPW